MNEEASLVVCKGVEVPGAVLRAEHGNRYGSVAGLDDDELLDPVELERAVYRQEFGAVLALPVKGSRGSGIRLVVLISERLAQLILTGCIRLISCVLRLISFVSS